MPALPPGKTYQLWAIVDKPMSAGTFRTDSGHKSRVVLKDLPDLSRISKFAVSLEPDGGRPQPTGAIYLAGQT
jgi:anti-sigma-K factor RskA